MKKEDVKTNTEVDVLETGTETPGLKYKLKNPSQESEKVLVDKITLDNIMQRLGELETSKSDKPIKRISPELQNKTCRVRFVETDKGDKVVVGYGKSWEEREKDGSKYLAIEVIDEDGNKHVVNFVNFNESGKQEIGEIININVENIEENIGTVFATKVDYDNYRSYESDQEVPLIVKSSKHTFKVKLPGGREVILGEDAVN